MLARHYAIPLLCKDAIKEPLFDTFGAPERKDSRRLSNASFAVMFSVLRDCTAAGTDVILEIFGPGDPVGAVAAYESRAYPASAVALEPTMCLLIPRQAFFALLDTYPTMVRGLLVGLTHRLVELTNRLTELSGGRIEARLARFLLKLTDDIGQRHADGIFIPLVLSRQEIADMIGTTIETSIRIMSRWGKDNVVRTEKEGFLVIDRGALEKVAMS